MNAPYTRAFSFSGFQSNRPNLPLPGQRVDIELDNIAQALASVGLGTGGGSGTPGGGPLKPIPPGTLLANLTSSTAIPTAVSVGTLKGSLGLGTAASLNVGEPGGVAAYNDPRFGSNADVSGFLTKAGNLFGLADLPTARQNLGLGAAATRSVGASGGLALYDDPRFGQGGGATPLTLDYVRLAAFVSETDGDSKWRMAVAKAIAALPPTGGTIMFPGQGEITFDQQVVITFPQGQACSLNFVGQYGKATVCHFPNGGGFDCRYNNRRHSCRWANMNITTGAVGVGSGIKIQNTSPFYNGNGFRPHERTVIENVVIAGKSTFGTGEFDNHYFEYGIDIRGIIFVEMDHITVHGGQTGAAEGSGGLGGATPLGVGICVQKADFGGDFSYTVICNIDNFDIQSCNFGFLYGDFVQGVSMSNGNWGNCNISIYNDQNNQGIPAQLYLVNCQVGICYGTSVWLRSPFFTFSCVNTTFYIKDGQNAVKMDYNVPFQLEDVWIQGELYGRSSGPSYAVGAVGIAIGPAPDKGGGVIHNLICNSVETGIIFEAGSSDIIADGLFFQNVPNTILDAGTRNTIGPCAHSEIGALPAFTVPARSRQLGVGSRPLRLRTGMADGTSRFMQLVTDPAGNLNLQSVTGGGGLVSNLFRLDDHLGLAVGSNFASARHNAVAIAANTATSVTWSTIEDTGGYRNTGAQGRFIAPATGLYSFTASVCLGTETAGSLRSIIVLKNGSTADLPAVAHQPAGSGANTQLSVSCTVRLNAGDYLTMQAFSDVATSTVANEGYASMMRVG